MSFPPLPPERRTRQRFAARKDGESCISIQVAHERLSVQDLSLDGFSLPACALAMDEVFDFEMRLVDGFGDRARGQAQVVNKFGEGEQAQLGCRFTTLDDAARAKIREWLTVIVICGAAVRISPEDAESIVTGPSLI